MRIKEILYELPVLHQQAINEIRLRVGRPVTLHTPTRVDILKHNGQSVVTEKQDIEESYRRICDFSIYSHQEEIKKGYITIMGGHRVGISGTAVLQQGQIATVREISSLNIRVARQVYGAANELLSRMGQDISKGLLIAGPPSCGKTTLLRDLARQLATGAGGIPKKVAIIDERGELAGTYCGIPQNDLGLCSDILDHYPKGEGMIQAVRALSPQFIFCDELGGQEDLEAVQQGLHAGAAMISTIHAGNIDDLLRKKQGQTLLQSQAFGYVAMMDAVALGQIAEIHKAGDLLGQIGRQYCSGVHDNAVRLHGVVETLESFLKVIRLMETEMRFHALPLRQIIDKYCGDMDLLWQCHLLLKTGKSFDEAWKSGVAAGTKGSGLKLKDKRLIEQFGAELGHTDIEGQIAHCEVTAKLLEEQIEQAREEKKKKSKLFSMLGLFFGTGVALLIC